MAHARRNRHDGRTPGDTQPTADHATAVDLSSSVNRTVNSSLFRESDDRIGRNPHPTQYHKYRTTQRFSNQAQSIRDSFSHTSLGPLSHVSESCLRNSDHHNRSLYHPTYSFPVPDIRPDRQCTYRLYHRIAWKSCTCQFHAHHKHRNIRPTAPGAGVVRFRTLPPLHQKKPHDIVVGHKPTLLATI